MNIVSYLIHQTYRSIRNEGLLMCARRVFSFVRTGRGTTFGVGESLDSSFVLPQRYIVKDEALMSGAVFVKPIETPLVSIIIPFKDRADLLRTCLESIITQTSYLHIEILLISNNSTQQEVFDCVDEYRERFSFIHFFEHNVVFNYAEINNWAVQHAQGEYIIFLNNDTKLITPDWIEIFLKYLTVSAVGAVGCRLFYPNETIQHGGIYISSDGYPHHVFRGVSRVDAQTYDTSARRCSAVTAACLGIKKNLFLSVGGFDEIHFPIDYNDVDLCFQVRERGLAVVYTPEIELYHYESVSRGVWSHLALHARAQSIGAYTCLSDRWPHFLERDPYISLLPE